MKVFLSIVLTIVLGLLATGCAGGMATLYSLEGKREIKIKISAGGLGEVLCWESTYEGKPAQ